MSPHQVFHWHCCESRGGLSSKKRAAHLSQFILDDVAVWKMSKEDDKLLTSVVFHYHSYIISISCHFYTRYFRIARNRESVKMLPEWNE